MRHDLAEAERYDREIVAAKAQGRRAEQDAEERGDRRRDKQHRPERYVDPELRAREHRVTVRADREECGVAEVEETREADDDVEPEREQHECTRIREKIDVRVVRVEIRESEQSDAEQG